MAAWRWKTPNSGSLRCTFKQQIISQYQRAIRACHVRHAGQDAGTVFTVAGDAGRLVGLFALYTNAQALKERLYA